MKKTVLNLLLACSLFACKGDKKDSTGETPSVSEVTYTLDDSKFPNPERGFYRYTESRLGASPTMLSESALRSYLSDNVSLIYRIYYLHDFRGVDLSQQALEQIGTDMATLRRAGLKCVLRFAYSRQQNEPDAPLDIVLRHLDQLRPIFEDHADVIALLQAGFIGAWGEWYYSSNNLKTDGLRATILNRMLDVLPSKRMIQLRTPAYKTNYLQRTTPLTRAEAYTGTKVARIGHHNDCFMASSTDYGTYENVQVQKTYLSADALYVPVGGETCPPDGVDPADCQKAEQEMKTLRWSFLNSDYYRGVNDRWISQGCMDAIIKQLGYRFALVSGKYSDKAAPSGTIAIELKINNLGYASPYNPRKVEFVLKNAATAEIYIATSTDDPRLWRPQAITELSFAAGLPSDMPEGMYDLYLNLPDPEASLYGRPSYSIRLAVKDCWDEITGYNNLFQRISIGKHPSPIYSGNIHFVKK
ncbi:MAG: DUF4832 domain-containing protein [Prevotellaceae bacterium]|jgi:hypothetical protein|nr:DUF4832 domain-containing protein [Prevotellaceae bacterium]